MSRYKCFKRPQAGVSSRFYMKSLKVKSCLIIALALVFIATLCAAFANSFSASADNVTISGSSVFYTSGEAKVKASGDGTENEEHYTMFVLTQNGDAINYNRNNLAYKWFENSATTTKTEGEGANSTTVTVEDEANPTKKAGWFNMEIGFKSLDFTKFIITFESQQYVKTKDEKTTNRLIFTPSGDKVDVEVDSVREEGTISTTVNADHIKITFGASATGGRYAITVTDGNSESKLNDFTNIGGTYSKYSTSSATPVTPLSFKAEFGEEDEEDASGKALMVMYNLNGQSFLLENATKGTNDEYYGGGTINDNVAPVLCLKQNVNYINEGTELNTDFFQTVDVIKQSPSADAAYFILTDEQSVPTYPLNPDDMSESGAFKVLKSGDGQRMILHADHYVPEISGSTVYDDEFIPNGAAKIYFKLTDTSYEGNSTYVLLDWYVESKYLLQINSKNYLAVTADKKGVTYTHTSGKTTNLSSSVWTAAKDEYEKAVAKAAEGLKPGSKNYFYVPAANGLFDDNATGFTDLSFTVYYRSNKSSSFSTTSGKASSLSIPLSNTGTQYVFTILATDAAGNTMYYYDKDGDKQEITSSAGNILDMYEDDDEKDYLPWFTFKVGTPEISVETPEEQDVAYKGTEYSFEFDINAVSGTYSAKYELFLFRNDIYYKENGEFLSYEEFMEKKDWLFENRRECFDIILATSEFESDTEEEEQYGDYAWNGSSRFTPQQGNAFYLVKLTVSSDVDERGDVVEYMGIAASIQVSALKGEDTWLQDNMTSVILLSVAGAALIGIILLLVIKPKDKGDVDEKAFIPEKKTKSKKQ